MNQQLQHNIISIILAIISVIAIYYIWRFNGFDARYSENIIYLFKYMAKERTVPTFIYLPLLLLIIPTIYIIYSHLNLSGIDHLNVHGDSRWGGFTDLEKAGLAVSDFPNELLNHKKENDGVVVGGYKTLFGKIKLIFHNGPEHMICFAPSRSGKGVSIIIPSLLSWVKNSVLVLDIKGENYGLTSGFRAKMGQRIIKFEPTNPKECNRFNPLAEIRFGTPNEFADVQNISMMIIDSEGKGLGNDYWANSGWIWMTTAILHCCYRWRLEKNTMPSLADVYNYINPDSAGGDSGGGLTQILQDMMEYDHQNAFINDNIKRGAGALLAKAEQERSGVHSSGSVKLGLFIEPTVAKNTATSDWTIDELMDGDKPVSCYLIVPPSDIIRLKPLIRIILTLLITKRTATMDFSGGKQKNPYKYRLLLLLDEFTSIGKIEIFEKAIGYIAGYGLKTYVIIQDLNQLYKEYTKDEAITSNCHVQVAFAPNTVPTAEYLQKRLGDRTIQLKNISTSSSKSGTSTSISYQSHKVPLLNTAQIMQLPMGKMLTMIAKNPPLLLNQPFFYKNKIMVKRTQIPAVFNDQEATAFKVHEGTIPTELPADSSVDNKPVTTN